MYCSHSASQQVDSEYTLSPRITSYTLSAVLYAPIATAYLPSISNHSTHSGRFRQSFEALAGLIKIVLAGSYQGVYKCILPISRVDHILFFSW